LCSLTVHSGPTANACSMGCKQVATFSVQVLAHPKSHWERHLDSDSGRLITVTRQTYVAKRRPITGMSGISLTSTRVREGLRGPDRTIVPRPVSPVPRRAFGPPT